MKAAATSIATFAGCAMNPASCPRRLSLCVSTQRWQGPANAWSGSHSGALQGTSGPAHYGAACQAARATAQDPGARPSQGRHQQGQVPMKYGRPLAAAVGLGLALSAYSRLGQGAATL